MKEILKKILLSWKNVSGNVCSMEDILSWIKALNTDTYVNIQECSIHDDNFWFYDDYNGEILNRKRSFFSIKGLRVFDNDIFITEQPVIFQPEIGYLGIICKEIDGVLNFLMQAKIEPGNINCVQISPTIQATKSNFTRAHGGRVPLYLEYFENSYRYKVIYDQIQSEQGSRFYHKRNRNMIMLVEEDIPVYDNFRWMTLGQIKKLMEIDNLVNMDTRTVLSGLPISTIIFSDEELKDIMEIFEDDALFRSMFITQPENTLPRIYQYVNNFKMFHNIKKVPIPLNQLLNWKTDDFGITCSEQAAFMIRYYDISISGREVQHWIQPLFKSIGEATFGLILCRTQGTVKFLVSARSEIGTFDKIELGPSIQLEPMHNHFYDDEVQKIFYRHISNNTNILVDVKLSEEGGRFFHEQNRNIILETDKEEFEPLPKGYFWTDYRTLNYLVQINNCLNIQLRNLLSLITI